MNTEVLIVEDEGLIALDLKKKLELSGYSVTDVVDNSEDALLSCERLRPSLVLMDIRLRGLVDGIETAERIRRQFHLPVIFVTAHADRETLERARITEPFGYIVKPFRGVDFRAPIEMALWKNKMEQKLRISEAWLSTTFRNVADGLIATDSDGTIVFMNPPAEKLTGWNWRDAKGEALISVFHVFDEMTGLPVAQPLTPVESGSAPRTFRLIPRGSSEAVVVEATLTANRDESTLIGYVAVFRDIRERRKAEKQARQLHKMNAVTGMATGLGRELTETQDRMEASLNYLIKQSTGSNSRRLWDVYECATRQQSVVRQLVMLGKTDAGEASLVDVNPFLTSLNDHLKRTVGIHQSVQLGLEVGVPAIRTDSRQLRENLLRLIADVRQAGEGGLPGSGLPNSGLPMVSTRTEISGEGKRCAQIVIRDTRKATLISQERIFDPYFQARPGKSNPGFSLALVYQFMAQCGGHIEVENTPEGPAYVMNFPAAEHAAAAKAELRDVQYEPGEKELVKTKSTTAGQR